MTKEEKCARISSRCGKRQTKIVAGHVKPKYFYIREEKYAQKSKKGIDKCCNLCYN